MGCILVTNFLILYRLHYIFQKTLLNQSSTDGQPMPFKVNRQSVRSSAGVKIMERSPVDVYRESERKTIKKIYFLLCLPTGRFIYEQWIRLIQMRSHKVNQGQHSPSIKLEVVNFGMPCTARTDSTDGSLRTENCNGAWTVQGPCRTNGTVKQYIPSVDLKSLQF